MNVFVLNTGRCGSTTFIQACQYITNYTARHESCTKLIGQQRLAYPANHIEADNRLSWFLGRLDQEYADRACYVHLSRNPQETAESFTKRQEFGIMRAYREGILLGGQEGQSAHDMALDYINTVEANIALFLKDKTNKLAFSLENSKADFVDFWQRIGAEGDLERALMEWDTRYNDSAQQKK